MTARILLLDGRSGAGKTVLSGLIGDAEGAVVVHMDDLYTGWTGLREGSEYATTRILEPLRRGEPARWQRWDWYAGERAEWHEIPAGSTVLLEGCGALSRANRALADFAIWLELPEGVRRARALERDGIDDWWVGWRAQEDAFIAAEAPRSLADLVLSPR